MTDCPKCGMPKVWSETHERVWCSVYGDHKQRCERRNVMLGSGPISNIIQFEIERERRVG